MKDILKAFRGNPDEFEVTLPMKYLLGSFGIMLILVPISLYVMLQDDVSDQIFVTFTCILVVDLVMMVFTDVLIVMIWCPLCFPKDKKRDQSNPGCAIQCLPMQITSDSVCSVPTDIFKDISVVELSRRLGDLRDEDIEDAKEGKESLPGDKPVCAAEVHKSSTSKSNNPNLDQNADFSRHAPISEQRFAYMRGPQQRVLSNPQLKDIKAIENFTYGYTGEPSRAYGPKQSRSDTLSRHCSVPGPSQKGFWYHKKQQYLAQQSMGDSKGKVNSKCTGDATQSKACGPNYANLDQSGASHGHVSKPVTTQGDGFTGYVKGQKNPDPSSPHQLMTESKQDSTSRYASGVVQSRPSERTNVSQHQNGTSSGHVSQRDGLRHDRHRKRFWTEPQPCTTRDSTKNDDDDEANLSRESLDEVIKNRYKEKVKPTVRGFVKLKKRYNPPDYMESVLRRRLFATSSASNIDDDLELLPLSNQSSTAAWVFDDKNELPSNCDSSPSFKRSRSAPSNRRRKLISSPTRSSDSSTNRFSIPACADDSRHRVLHRLLATILTTGDDVIAAYPELENSDEEQDAPKMEVEALPSGDYVMHISMRMTSKELQNFRSRRATNFKDSEFKKYLATLC